MAGLRVDRVKIYIVKQVKTEMAPLNFVEIKNPFGSLQSNLIDFTQTNAI